MKNKNQNLDFNYQTFDNHKFIRNFKRTCEQTVFLGKFKITGKDKELNKNYELIYKYLTSITRNKIVFENDLIYIAIIEVTSYIDICKNFIEIIKGVHTHNGWEERQIKFIERQLMLLNHLRELYENPTKPPNFIKED